MEFRHLILPAVVAPAAIAWGVVVLLGIVARRRGSTSSLVDGAGLAIALAILAAFVASTGWPSWPPVDSTQRLVYLILVAGLSTLVPGLERNRPVRWLWWGSLLTAALMLLLKTPLRHSWDARQAAIWLIGLLVVGIAATAALARGLESARPRRWPASAVRIAIPATTALVLVLSASVRLALLAAALATAMTVVEATAYRRNDSPWRAVHALPLSVSLLGLLLAGSFYAEVGVWPAVLIVAAILLTVRSGSRRTAWLALLPLIAAAATVIAGQLGRPEDLYDYSGLSTGSEKTWSKSIQKPQTGHLAARSGSRQSGSSMP